MAIKSTGWWNVRSTHSNVKRELWHRVANFSGAFHSGTTNRANTVCGLVYDFPTANTIFAEDTGADPLLCVECYSNHE